MKDKPTHLDLFSGIGGFSLAFEREGFETIGFSEINPYACRVLAKNWPDVRNYGDIRNVGTVYQKIHVLTGGFPCQDISIAKQNAKGIEGERSAYWFWMLETIKRNKPDFCLIENVLALRTRGADRVLSGLERAGYAARPLVVQARVVGADQLRERVWVFAYAQRLGTLRFIPRGDSGTAGQRGKDSEAHFTSKDWRTRPLFGGGTTPILCRGGNGVPSRMDRIERLGNAIVPQVAQVFARAIHQYYSKLTSD